MVIYILLAWLLTSFDVGHASCMCNSDRRHPQTHYCRADFVIKAKVLHEVKGKPEQDDDGSLITSYRLDIEEIFKNDQRNPMKLGMNYIWTPKIGSCKQFFRLGLTHLIFGISNIRKLTYKTNSCFPNQIWVGVPVGQVIGVQQEYKKYCDICKIKTCQQEKEKGSCDVPWCCGQLRTYKPRKECLLVDNFPYSTIGMCYKRFSYCHVNKGYCEFKKTGPLRSCIEGQQRVMAARGLKRKYNSKRIMNKELKRKKV